MFFRCDHMVMCHIDMNRIYRRMGISLYRSKEVGGDLDKICHELNENLNSIIEL